MICNLIDLISLTESYTIRIYIRRFEQILLINENR